VTSSRPLLIPPDVPALRRPRDVDRPESHHCGRGPAEMAVGMLIVSIEWPERASSPRPWPTWASHGVLGIAAEAAEDGLRGFSSSTVCSCRSGWAPSLEPLPGSDEAVDPSWCRTRTSRWGRRSSGRRCKLMLHAFSDDRLFDPRASGRASRRAPDHYRAHTTARPSTPTSTFGRGRHRRTKTGAGSNLSELIHSPKRIAMTY